MFPPATGCLKIYYDGAFSSSMEAATIGVIYQNNFGQFRRGYVNKVKSIYAFMTEALALKRALMLVVDLGHNKVVFETDCLPLLTCVKARSPNLFD